jgi:hypothetical protein
MNSKLAKFTTSLMSLLGEAAPEQTAKARIEAIRQAMLDNLADVGPHRQLDKVHSRVRFAPDIQALWYLRGDIMTLLAESRGEAHATERLTHITTLFHGLLPAAQQSRPHRLGR